MAMLRLTGAMCHTSQVPEIAFTGDTTSAFLDNPAGIEDVLKVGGGKEGQPHVKTVWKQLENRSLACLTFAGLPRVSSIVPRAIHLPPACTSAICMTCGSVRQSNGRSMRVFWPAPGQAADHGDDLP